MKFPDMVHSLKPSPITNQQDPNRFFDFFSHIPESTHMLTFLFTDQGTPANLRQMDGFGVHAFKFVNSAGEVTYVKFNWHSMQGLANFTGDEPGVAMGKNFSGHTQDLYDHIKKGEFPSWELGVQTIKPADLDKFAFNPLDATKVWTGVPEIKVGKMTLNKVPDNFFEFTESGRLLARNGHPGRRAVRRPPLAGPPVLVRRHPAVPPRDQLPDAPGQPAGRPGVEQQPGRLGRRRPDPLGHQLRAERQHRRQRRRSPRHPRGRVQQGPARPARSSSSRSPRP